jgi:hypothetical protein
MDSPLSAEASAKVNISGYGKYANLAPVNLPQGQNVSWSLTVNGQTGPWRTFAVPAVATGNLNVVKDTDYCVVVINNTSGGQVAISGTGNVTGSIVLPMGINVSWHLTVSGQTGPWIVKNVNCTDLDASTAFCNMAITGVPTGGQVAISGTGNVTGSIILPSGINVSWHLTVNGQTGPWKTKKVDCTDLALVSGTDYCTITVNASAGNTVSISGTGSYTTKTDVILPQGINISWKLNNGSWQSLYLDCTAKTIP